MPSGLVTSERLLRQASARLMAFDGGAGAFTITAAAAAEEIGAKPFCTDIASNATSKD